MLPRNNAKRWVIVSVFLFIIGVVMIFAGIIINDYNFYWMIMVGLLLALTFFICFFVFIGQAKRLERMFKGKELLVHWHFPPNEQQKKAKTELNEQKGMHMLLMIVITTFFVVITGMFMIFGFDDVKDAVMFMGMMGGILALIFSVAMITPRIAYNKMRQSLPEVYVGPYGAWVMGQYSQWKTILTKISSVNLTHGETGAVIEVWFMIWQRYGFQLHVCRIPAPDGQEEKAKQIAKDLAEINQVDYTDEEIQTWSS